jgi:tRNA pseudouridine(55) synthase
MTSHDVVHLARVALGENKIGHLGTLDPPAAGVLPLAVGPATRLATLLQDLPKEYRAELLFGVASTTGDLAGELTVAAEPPRISRSELEEAIGSLVGKHLQAPPAYSARKVNGRRLYDLARKGCLDARDLDRRAREVHVYESRLVSCGPSGPGPYPGLPRAVIDIACSSGTYVRQLAATVAAGLGATACVSFLLRTRACGFRLRECLTVEELLAPSMTASALTQPIPVRGWRPAAGAVGFLEGLVVDPAASDAVLHGGPVSPAGVLARVPGVPFGGWEPAARGGPAPLRLLDREGRLLAIAREKDGRYWPYAVMTGGNP